MRVVFPCGPDTRYYPIPVWAEREINPEAKVKIEFLSALLEKRDIADLELEFDWLDVYGHELRDDLIRYFGKPEPIVMLSRAANSTIDRALATGKNRVEETWLYGVNRESLELKELAQEAQEDR